MATTNRVPGLRGRVPRPGRLVLHGPARVAGRPMTNAPRSPGAGCRAAATMTTRTRNPAAHPQPADRLRPTAHARPVSASAIPSGRPVVARLGATGPSPSARMMPIAAGVRAVARTRSGGAVRLPRSTATAIPRGAVLLPGGATATMTALPTAPGRDRRAGVGRRPDRATGPVRRRGPATMAGGATKRPTRIRTKTTRAAASAGHVPVSYGEAARTAPVMVAINLPGPPAAPGPVPAWGPALSARRRKPVCASVRPRLAIFAAAKTKRWARAARPGVPRRVVRRRAGLHPGVRQGAPSRIAVPAIGMIRWRAAARPSLRLPLARRLPGRHPVARADVARGASPTRKSPKASQAAACWGGGADPSRKPMHPPGHSAKSRAASHPNRPSPGVLRVRPKRDRRGRRAVPAHGHVRRRLLCLIRRKKAR